MSITVTTITPEPYVLANVHGVKHQLSKAEAIELRNAIDAALGWPDGIQHHPPKVQAVIEAARAWRVAYTEGWHDEKFTDRAATMRIDLSEAVQRLGRT